MPDRLAALDRHLPATRRPRRAPGGRPAEGPPLPAIARRAGGIGRAAGCGPPRRARCAACPARATGRAGAAAGGRGFLPRMARGRPLRAGAAGIAVRCARAHRVHPGRAHAGGRLHHPARPAQCVAAPRCRQRRAARQPRSSPDRDHLGRRHPGHGRLRSGARTAGDPRRHHQRGLRGREPGRRHLPARQPVLPHPARGERAGAGGGRAGRAADHPVLAGRGAGPQRRAVACGGAAAPGPVGPPRRAAARHGGRCRRATRRARRGGHAGLARRRARAWRCRRAPAGRLPRFRAGGAGCAADPGRARDGAVLRRIRWHPAHHPLALRQPPQPRLGPRTAQALLPQLQLRAAGGGDRGCDRAVALDQPQLPARGRRALPPFQQRARRAGAGAAGRADVRPALALECHHLARPAALPGRQQGAAAAAADEIGRPAGDGVPRPGRLPREHRRRAPDPRSSAGGADARGLPARGDGHRRPGRPAAAAGARRCTHPGARPHRAVAARGRSAGRTPVCLPRRRAAGGAPHPGGREPPLGGSGKRRRPRPARSRRDRCRPRRSLAGSAFGRRAARGTDGDRLARRRRSACRAGLASMARHAGRRSPCHLRCVAGRQRLARGRAAAAARGDPSRCHSHAIDHGAAGIRGRALVARGGTGRPVARAHDRARPGDRQRDRGIAVARGGGRRLRPAEARRRGVRPAWALHRRRA